jgi:hypothetical protein
MNLPMLAAAMQLQTNCSYVSLRCVPLYQDKSETARAPMLIVLQAACHPQLSHFTTYLYSCSTHVTCRSCVFNVAHCRCLYKMVHTEQMSPHITGACCSRCRQQQPQQLRSQLLWLCCS